MSEVLFCTTYTDDPEDKETTRAWKDFCFKASMDSWKAVPIIIPEDLLESA